MGAAATVEAMGGRGARRSGGACGGRSNQTLEERENNPIIHLKKLNNWIKSVLIQLYAHQGDCVLDLACGKGGDLIKWDKAKVGYYVGVDIAAGSIKDCMTRYNGDTDQQRRKKFSFPARLICADCYESNYQGYLKLKIRVEFLQTTQRYKKLVEKMCCICLVRMSGLVGPVAMLMKLTKNFFTLLFVILPCI